MLIKVDDITVKKVIGAVTVFLILFGGLILIKTQMETTKISKGCSREAKLCPDGSTVQRVSPRCEFTPCPKIREEKVETKTWESYRNNTYGYAFRYPQNLFPYKGAERDDLQFFSNKPGGSPPELGDSGVWISATVASPSARLMYEYQKILHIKESALIPESAILKIKDIVNSGVRGSLYYQGTPPHFSGEGAYSYEALWIREGVVYHVSLGAFSEQTIKQYQTMFTTLITTLTFSPLFRRPDGSYVCPQSEWVDCTRGKAKDLRFCSDSYLRWAKENCISFKGASY